MSQRINQPVQSIKLTNVAVVRMNRHGKRFEIACYRNKVVNYRQGLETDIDEVLQTDRIFTNVSKGQFASSTLLEQTFQTTDEMDVAKIILQKGTLQISDLERQQQYENTIREVASWVSTNCVHPTSQRPYTPSQIREAMKQVEFAVHPTHSIKKQYLDCVKLLQSSTKGGIPIERAKMELSIHAPKSHLTKVHDALQQLNITPTTNSNPDPTAAYQQLIVLVDPSLYRPIDTLVKELPNGARLEILRQAVTQEGDINLEEEMKRRQQNTSQQQLQQQQDQDQQTTTTQTKITHNDEEYALSALMEEQLTLDKDNTDNDHDTRKEKDSDGELPSPQKPPEPQVPRKNMRKSQKKAQKQSKKAKRREKEEAAERQARIEQEKKRQEERNAMLRMKEEQQQESSSTPLGNQSTSVSSETSTAAKSCNTCGGSFVTPASYRSHFKSDWHRYNIKLKMKGVTPVSEQEFILCDSDAFFDDM